MSAAGTGVDGVAAGTGVEWVAAGVGLGKVTAAKTLIGGTGRLTRPGSGRLLAGPTRPKRGSGAPDVQTDFSLSSTGGKRPAVSSGIIIRNQSVF